MPLRTLHKDSCLDLKALAGQNDAIDKGLSKGDRNSHDSNIIDLDMFNKDADEACETPSPTETDVSSDDSNEDFNDCSMTGMDDAEKSLSSDENNGQSIPGKNKKIMSMLFAWRKNKENSRSEETACPTQNTTFIEEKKVSEDEPNESPSFLYNDIKTNNNRNLKRAISPAHDEQTDSLSQEISNIVQKSIMKKKKHNVKKNVTFSTTARLITIYPHKDLPPYLKRQIWWQRTDYKNFKKTIDIISRELLQHASNDVWFLGAQDHRYVAPTERSEENQFGAKWWCQYGHSRRGLEHICSMAEGRFRQQNVERATTCTLIEQERQSLLERSDPRKLGMAAFRFTSFARDLARAVGKADAEAVRVNFEVSKMKDFRHFMSSKYEKGFVEWDRALSRDLSPYATRDVFAARTNVIDDDASSELDSFCENPSLH